jgi:hypothetical protein
MRASVTKQKRGKGIQDPSREMEEEKSELVTNSIEIGTKERLDRTAEKKGKSQSSEAFPSLTYQKDMATKQIVHQGECQLERSRGHCHEVHVVPLRCLWDTRGRNRNGNMDLGTTHRVMAAGWNGTGTRDRRVQSVKCHLSQIISSESK